MAMKFDTARAKETARLLFRYADDIKSVGKVEAKAGQSVSWWMGDSRAGFERRNEKSVAALTKAQKQVNNLISKLKLVIIEMDIAENGLAGAIKNWIADGLDIFVGKSESGLLKLLGRLLPDGFESTLKKVAAAIGTSVSGLSSGVINSGIAFFTNFVNAEEKGGLPKVTWGSSVTSFAGGLARMFDRISTAEVKSGLNFALSSAFSVLAYGDKEKYGWFANYLTTKQKFELETVSKFKKKFLDDEMLLGKEFERTYGDKDLKMPKDVATLYGKQISAEFEAALYSAGISDKGDLGNYSIDIDVGKLEAYAKAGVGFVVVEKNGKKYITPKIDVAIGASVTALEIKAEGQLGNDMLGVHGEVDAVLGKAAADAKIGAYLFDEKGNFNPEIKAKGELEAIAAEVSGKVGVDLAGTKVDAVGKLNVGIGAHAEVGISGGKLKVDIGASLGVGASVSLEVDFSGTVDAVVSGAKAAWDVGKNIWNGAKGLFGW